MSKIRKTSEEWRKQLTPEQYRVTRLKETEPAFTGEYVDCFDEGVYYCACCDQELFESRDKLDADCGWPSFTQAADTEAVLLQPDYSTGALRIEIVCRQCDAHLGHVPNDGPYPAGHRYYTNSTALKFRKKVDVLALA